MSIEVLLFLLLGAVAIASAAMMLLSANAVHSALFLVLNFLCVAVMYILLDAAFLALVQITVYAGAIMVLFLFVIMLLGAEKVMHNVRQFKWVPPLALTLAMSFLIMTSLAIFAGDIDGLEVPSAQMARVVNLAPDVGSVDIQLGDRIIGEGIEFQQATEFVTVAPGQYVVTATGENGVPLEWDTVTVEAGQNLTIIAYGEGFLPFLASYTEDLSEIGSAEGRMVVFNAHPEYAAVDLVNTGSDFRFDSVEEAEAARRIVDQLGYGQASEAMMFPEGDPSWAFVDDANVDNVLFRLRDFEFERHTAKLVALVGERDTTTELLSPRAAVIITPTQAQFGSPQQMGQLLFVDYVLAFEVVALLLLAAMVGAIVLTERQEIRPKPGRPTRRKVSRPLTSVITSQTGHSLEDDSPRLPQPDVEAEQPAPAGD